MTQIADKFDPELTKNAGFLQVSEAEPKGLGVYGKTLLNLLHWLTYTEDGRGFAKKSKVTILGKDQTAEAREKEVRDALRKEYTSRLIPANQTVLDALVECSIAADRWVAANTAAQISERDRWEAIYKQNMSVVTWWLWEDSLGNDFALNW